MKTILLVAVFLITIYYSNSLQVPDNGLTEAEMVQEIVKELTVYPQGKSRSGQNPYFNTRHYIQTMIDGLREAANTVPKSYLGMADIVKSREEDYYKILRIFLESVTRKVEIAAQNVLDNVQILTSQTIQCVLKLKASADHLEQTTLAGMTTCAQHYVSEVQDKLTSATTLSSFGIRMADKMASNMQSCGQIRGVYNQGDWEANEAACLRKIVHYSQKNVPSVIAQITKMVTNAASTLVLIPIQLSTCSGDALAKASHDQLEMIQKIDGCNEEDESVPNSAQGFYQLQMIDWRSKDYK